MDVAEGGSRSHAREEIEMSVRRGFWGEVSDQHWSIKGVVLTEPFLDIPVTTQTDVESVTIG
jgi:hypothetical protein